MKPAFSLDLDAIRETVRKRDARRDHREARELKRHGGALWNQTTRGCRDELPIYHGRSRA